MKNIEVTYDALICENGTYEQGEAAFILPMTDELAADLSGCRTTLTGGKYERKAETDPRNRAEI